MTGMAPLLPGGVREAPQQEPARLGTAPTAGGLKGGHQSTVGSAHPPSSHDLNTGVAVKGTRKTVPASSTE